jgi:hypothetical protein
MSTLIFGMIENRTATFFTPRFVQVGFKCMTAFAFHRFGCQGIRHYFTHPIYFPGAVPENSIGTNIDCIDKGCRQPESLPAAGRRNDRPLCILAVINQRLPSRMRLSKEWRIRLKRSSRYLLIS